MKLPMTTSLNAINASASAVIAEPKNKPKTLAQYLADTDGDEAKAREHFCWGVEYEFDLLCAAACVVVEYPTDDFDEPEGLTDKETAEAAWKWLLENVDYSDYTVYVPTSGDYYNESDETSAELADAIAAELESSMVGIDVVLTEHAEATRGPRMDICAEIDEALIDVSTEVLERPVETDFDVALAAFAEAAKLESGLDLEICSQQFVEQMEIEKDEPLAMSLGEICERGREYGERCAEQHEEDDEEEGDE